MTEESRIEKSDSEYRVVGPPGCGVEEAVNAGRTVLISSLTKAAAAEIGGRGLPIHWDSLGTLHSHCYHALGEPQIAEGREHIEQWNEDEPEYRMSLGSTDLGGKIDGDNLEPARETVGDELMDLYQIHRARMDMERMPAAALHRRG